MSKPESWLQRRPWRVGTSTPWPVPSAPATHKLVRRSHVANRHPLIAHVLPWSGVGGTEWGTVRLIQALGAGGFGHVALVRRDAPAVAELLAQQNLPVLRFENGEFSGRESLAFLRTSWRLSRALRRNRVALLHCADLLGVYQTWLAALLAGVPLTTHIRCQYPDIPPRQRWLLKAVRHFCFVSEDARRSFGAVIPPDRSSVVHDVITIPEPKPAPPEVDIRARLGLPSDAIVVGMVARVAPAKDFPTLLGFASHLKAAFPEAHVIVVGDFDSAPSYQQHHQTVCAEIKTRGLEHHVHFLGPLPTLDGIWPQFTVSVLATHTEGLPLVLLEAMAAGCPVVATRVGGIPEVVEDGVTGLLHEHGDAEGLFKAVSLLLTDPLTRERLVAAGREGVRDRFSSRLFGSVMGTVFARFAR